MRPRYLLAAEAAADLVEIWRYIKKESTEETANGIENVIRGKLGTKPLQIVAIQ